MAIKKLNIREFLSMRQNAIVIDVRSPGEYDHAHIPGAYTLPLFSDEERKVVGTLYKQQGKQIAIKKGLEYFGVKMREMVEAVEKILKEFHQTKLEKPKIFVHCWRGGMRSAGVAWLLDLYGFDVFTLVGGYKAFRGWVLQQFENDFELMVVGGYTGSGKTEILDEMKGQGLQVINLEGLANHKGSAFGGINQPVQPSQEMFENKLALNLHLLSGKSIWIEDESQRIGVLNIPHAFWRRMRKSPVYFIDLPFEERLQYINTHYGDLPKEKLEEAVLRIQKRLGPLETKTVLNHLENNEITTAFRLLLQYYDKTYIKALHNREDVDRLVQKISADTVNHISNTEKIIACVAVNS
jgi:tRNA 2-selenouridine synthase